MALPVVFNTNNQTVVIGPFVDSTDGVTAENGLTITNNDLKIIKHGASTMANKSAGNATHIASGYYYFNLMAADTDTYGRLQVCCTMSGAVPVWQEFQVMNATAFNVLYGNNSMPSDVQTMAANVVTASAFNQAAADKVWATTTRELSSSNNVFTANAITAASFNQGAADKVWSTAARTLTANNNLGLLTSATTAAAIWDTARSSYANSGTFGEGVASVQGNVTGTLSTLASNSVTAAAFNQAAADKVWASTGRTVTSAANITSNNNKLVLHTDDKVLLAGTTHTSAVVPTVSTLTGHTAQTGDTYALANGANGFSAIKTETAAILADTGTDGVVVAAGSKTGYALSSGGIDAVWDQASSMTTSFEGLLTRLYQMINNRMTVNESTGAVALRNIGNSADIATGSVASSSGTTTRAELSWV